MCIMIYKPARRRVTRKELELCWDNNPDGGGVLFVTPSHKFNILKTMDKKEWVDHCMKHMKKTLWIHARYTTRGENNEKNCHPFWGGKNIMAFMNGTVKDMPDEDERSDTRIMCEDLLPGLPDGWLDNPSIFELVRGYIHKAGQTHGTKFMFVNRYGRTWILNEDLGHWHKGMWFSNEWYKKDRKPKTTYSTTSGGGSWSSYDGGSYWGNQDYKDFTWCNTRRAYVHDKTNLTLKEMKAKEVDDKKKKEESKVKGGTITKTTVSEGVKTVETTKNGTTTVKTTTPSGSTLTVTTKPAKSEPRPQLKEEDITVHDTSAKDLLSETECLYCGVPLLGEDQENLESLTCGGCQNDQDLAAEELVRKKEFTSDELRYLQVNAKPFNELSDEDFMFLQEFEMSKLEDIEVG